MQKRKLGNTGIEVAPLALGCNVFGWTADEPTSFKILDAFVDASFNLIDTADMYSTWVPGHRGGESEAIIGKWLKRSGKRDRVVLATKVGKSMGEGKSGLSSSYIRSAVEDSLRRLQTDCIDLYQSHEDDPKTTLEETLETFTELIKQGQVRAIGASNYAGPRLAEALDTSRVKGLASYQTLQPEYNLVQRADYETNLEPVCKKYGLGVITYFSLARGFLTGKYRSQADLAKSPRGQGVKQFLNERGLRILKALDDVARRYNSTPTQVALAWLLTRRSVTAPIASATNLEQLKDLIASAQLRLDAESVRELDEASAEQGPGKGTRAAD